MSKDQVSSAYIKEMQQDHLPKAYPKPEQQRIVITGAEKDGSIGNKIMNKMLGHTLEVRNTRFDVTDPNAVSFRPDDTALIMCHGATHMDWLENAPWQEITHVIDVNLFGTINCVQNFVNDTINSPFRKKIIGIGSMAYRHILNGSAAYCASKAGMAHFMRCAAWELAPKGYDVFTVHPSNVDGTPMAEETIVGLMRYRNIDRKEAEAYWANGYIRGRSLTTDEIADLVGDLVFNAGLEFLSGQQFELTGGQR